MGTQRSLGRKGPDFDDAFKKAQAQFGSLMPTFGGLSPLLIAALFVLAVRQGSYIVAPAGRIAHTLTI